MVLVACADLYSPCWYKGKVYTWCLCWPAASAAFTSKVVAWLTAQSNWRWAPTDHQ